VIVAQNAALPTPNCPEKFNSLGVSSQGVQSRSIFGVQSNQLLAENTPYSHSCPFRQPTIRVPYMKSPRYIDVDISLNSVISNWSIVDMTPITQGAGNSNRVGPYARIMRVEVGFQMLAINADIFTATRFMIIQWLPQSNNQAFTMSEVMQTNNSLNSFTNFDASAGFSVLEDHKITQAGTPSAPTATGYLSYDFVVDLRRCMRNQLYATNTTSSFGKLFFVAISNSSVAPFPSIQGISRTYFASE